MTENNRVPVAHRVTYRSKGLHPHLGTHCKRLDTKGHPRAVPTSFLRQKSRGVGREVIILRLLFCKTCIPVPFPRALPEVGLLSKPELALHHRANPPGSLMACVELVYGRLFLKQANLGG